MSTASNKRLRTAYLVASYLAFFIAVAHAIFASENDFTFQFLGSILAVLVTMACAYDAAVLGRPWAFGARFPFLAVWPVATPRYVIGSRGWRGCVILLIHVSLLVATLVAVAIVVGVRQFVGR